MYHSGHGVELDFKMAVKYYQMSADKGYSYAQYNLASMYSSGLGVEKDMKLAVKYYQMSAEQGYVRAQFVLAEVFRRGAHGKIEEELALKYYQKACEQKHEQAREIQEQAREMLRGIFSGKCGDSLRIVANLDLARRWPKCNPLEVHEGCRSAILEIVYCLRILRSDIPTEIFLEVSKAIIVGWTQNHHFLN